MGPEPIPAGVCPPDQPDKKYLGSSGYRLIPGNTCDREAGIKKDEKVEKDCANGMSEMVLDVVISLLKSFQQNPPKARSCTKS